MPWFLVDMLHMKAAELKRVGVLQKLSESLRLNLRRGIARADLRLTKVFCDRSICDGFLAGAGYKIVVDDSGYPCIPGEIEDS
jgi:hypothetical protein